jgi:hypothetical protein
MESSDLPFEIGSTFFNGTSIIADVNKLNLGAEFQVPDSKFGLATGRLVTVRMVRNTSGGTLYPSLGVHFDETVSSYPYGTAVGGSPGAGHSFSTTKPIGIVDPALPAAGVANNDIFWIVVEGPAMGKTGHTIAPAIAVGDLVQAFSTTSGGTTGNGAGAVGRFTSIAQGATTGAIDQLNSLWGRAMSAATTNNTHTLTLIDLKRTFG